jgi:hypothetical protein
MRSMNVTFDNWVRSHAHKQPKERWLRELYPWPVLTQVGCAPNLTGQLQRFRYDGVDFKATLKSARWQPDHGIPASSK